MKKLVKKEIEIDIEVCDICENEIVPAEYDYGIYESSKVNMIMITPTYNEKQINYCRITSIY